MSSSPKDTPPATTLSAVSRSGRSEVRSTGVTESTFASRRPDGATSNSRTSGVVASARVSTAPLRTVITGAECVDAAEAV